MAAQIIYLLGAGASCDTMPLASALGERLEKASEQIRKDGEYAKELLENFDWLAVRAKEHATVDTLARKYWIRNDSDAKRDLLRLKAVLSCFFQYETARFSSDKRHDSFFASILDRSEPGKPSFPGSISILTWNYDLLLEKSYQEFSAAPEDARKRISEKAIHLNGMAAVRFLKPVEREDVIYFPDADTDYLVKLYSRIIKNEYRPEIKFAWENTDILSKASHTTAGTEILVVIGYSFPFFNQDIDKALLKQMEGSLKRIFLQTNGDVVGRERLLNLLQDVQYPDGPVRSRWGEHVEMIDGTDYFYIPNEFIREGSS